MNKLLLSLGLALLLSGCGEAEQPKPVQEPTAATPAASPASEDKTKGDSVADSKAVEDKTAETKAEPTQPNANAAPIDNGAAQATGAEETLVIDATNEQTMTASLDKMIATLSDAEKETFAEAFLVYAMSKVDMSVDEEANQKNMLAALNGKSVKDILQEADKIKASDANVEKAEQK